MRFIPALLVLSAFSAFTLLGADTPSVVSSVRPDSAQTRDIMTNEGIVVLSDAGFTDAFIVEKMLISRTRFDTSVEGLAYLLRSGISQELVQFVLERSVKPSALTPAAVPTYVPMKVVKRKVLVPDTSVMYSSANPPMVPALTPGPSAYAGRWILVNGSPALANGYGWPGYAQAGYGLSYPVLQPPALPASASAPIMTPAASYGWIAAR